MKYLCLVYFDEKKLNAMSKSESDALTEESLTYDEVLRKSGHFIVAEALQPVQAANTVRVRKDKVSITDGPFAETKEQLGGFILINARDLNDAIQVASKIPLARLGNVEVRPIKELGGAARIAANSRSLTEASPMDEIQGIARDRIYDGKLEEFKRLAAKCMQSVRSKDSGTLQYDWFFSADYSECIVYERYRDSDALLEHVANLGDTMKELLQTCSVSGEILGAPSAALRKALEGVDVRIYAPYQSI
jgi:quinol monooxygenase YgiN